MKKRLSNWVVNKYGLLELLPSQISCNKKDNLVCTVSGGRSSMLQAIMLQARYPNKNILFLFANTGKEHPKTLEFVRNCANHFGLNIIWVEALVNPVHKKGTEYVIVDFETANRDGSVFESVIKKYGLPSKLWRHCTRELKTKPINKFSDDFFGAGNYIKFLGMRKDEPHRTKPKKDTFYMLSELGVTKQFVLDWFSRQDVDLEINEEQGNCDLCPLKSKRKRMTVIKNDPDTAIWWLNMEQVYQTERQPMFDVRNNLTMEQLVELASQDFKEFKAVSTGEDTDFDLDLDIEFSCFCSNT